MGVFNVLSKTFIQNDTQITGSVRILGSISSSLPVSSSGLRIHGDSKLGNSIATKTMITGSISISGSEYITGSSQIKGNQQITGSLSISGSFYGSKSYLTFSHTGSIFINLGTSVYKFASGSGNSNYRMIRNGRVTGISQNFNLDAGGGGSTIFVKSNVLKNGESQTTYTTYENTIDDSSNIGSYSILNPFSFNANDVIGVVITGSESEILNEYTIKNMTILVEIET